MTKRAFDKIMEGLQDAVAIVEGRADPTTYRVHIPTTVDTRAIRARMRLSRPNSRTDTAFRWRQCRNMAILSRWHTMASDS